MDVKLGNEFTSGAQKGDNPPPLATTRKTNGAQVPNLGGRPTQQPSDSIQKLRLVHDLDHRPGVVLVVIAVHLVPLFEEFPRLADLLRELRRLVSEFVATPSKALALGGHRSGLRREGSWVPRTSWGTA